MVELQIVVLAVAGSSPVGHPPALPAGNSKSQTPGSNLRAPLFSSNWNLGFDHWNFCRTAAVAYALLKKRLMLNPALVEVPTASPQHANFWLRLVNDKALHDCNDLEKLIIGCEIIAALDAVELLAA